ncbi:molybdenum ABC transporter ATP-binding protein [Sphingopyxis sp. MWB1]|uniref:molybdenum ABC transporter ATP-binding protein n=1 Tax=Sphingopyxis sp. MWB1 TaxID=1537715 RepID=UPI00051A7611|nr:ATP-binding cassette domain-containing protein [Sphingopyxis sp. MWB1]
MSFDVEIARRLGETRIAVQFRAASGLTALFGRSGAGKTSVLNMIAGLLTPDEGYIRVGDRTLFDASVNLPPEARRIGYVFQEGRLFPHLKVRDNLLYGQRLARAEARWMSLDEASDFLGIGHLLDRAPASLSGGEARRVAIGRALLCAPSCLLMDEPLSALDAPRREEVMRVIERVRDRLKLPILYVSHDRAEVERLATQIVPMA